MGLLDSILSPNTGWLGDRFNQYRQDDIDNLLHAYDPNSSARALIAGYGQPSTNPADYTNLWNAFGSQPAQPSTNPADYAGLKDAFGDQASKPWLNFRPGSILDRMMNSGGVIGMPSFSQPGAQPSPPQPGASVPQQPPSRPPLMNVTGNPVPASNAGMSQFPDTPAALPGGIRPSQFSGALPVPQAPTEASSVNRTAAAPVAAPAMAPSQEPDRLNAGLGSFVGNLHNGPLAAIIGGLGGAVTGKRNDPYGISQENQQTTMKAVYQALIAKNYPSQVALGMAQAASVDPKVAERLLGDAFSNSKNMEEAVTRQFENQSRGPGGAQPSLTPYENFLRTQSRGKSAGETEGKRAADAQLDLPTAVAQANEALRLANDLRTHKGREGNVWWHNKLGGYLPDSSIAGNTDAKDAMSILNQLKGGAFLTAFNTLRGGGQITEIEGKKATDAIARMDRSQSKAEFDRALSDYEGVIRLGVDRANQLAGQPAPNQFKGNSVWQNVSPGVRIRQVQ